MTKLFINFDLIRITDYVTKNKVPFATLPKTAILRTAITSINSLQDYVPGKLCEEYFENVNIDITTMFYFYNLLCLSFKNNSLVLLTGTASILTT